MHNNDLKGNVDHCIADVYREDIQPCGTVHQVASHLFLCLYLKLERRGWNGGRRCNISFYHGKL